MFIRSLAAIIFFLCVTPAFGDSLEDAVNEYFVIMQSGDFRGAGELFDPEELESFRQSLEFLAQAPLASQEQFYEQLFGPGSTAESVSALSDSEFFESFFSLAMAQLSGLEIERLEYLGHVMEGPDVAHAVTRLTASVSDARFTKLSVASFVRRGYQWKMMMSGDIRSIATQVRKAVGM